MDFTEKQEFAKRTVCDTLKTFEITYDSFHVSIVGSAYIHDKETSDIDVLVLIETGQSERTGGIEVLAFPGWQYGGSAGEGDDCMWGSWKKTVQSIEVNMLLTNSEEFYRDWITSAEVCRYLHRRGILRDERLDRVAIHQIIMEGHTAEEIFPSKATLPPFESFY